MSMEREKNVTLPESEDKEQPVSSQVLEYYQKYSLNRELPKYFSGTSSLIKSRELNEFSAKKPNNWNKIYTKEPSTSSVNEGITISVAVNTEEVVEELIQPSILQSEHTDPTNSHILIKANLDELGCTSSEPVINEHVLATSPASSVTSNRKLEWDNGADIGYNNVTIAHKVLQKSISLPVLNTVEYEKLQKSLLGPTFDRNTEIPQIQVKQLDSDKNNICDLINNLSYTAPYSTSTSEGVQSLKRGYESSSTSECNLKQQFVSSSESSSEINKQTSVLTFLKGKIGLPVAESTPIIQFLKYSETPKLSSLEKNKICQEEDAVSNNPVVFRKQLSTSCEDLSASKIDNSRKRRPSQIDVNMVDRISHYKNMKVLKLCVSKPIIVECVNVFEPQTGKNKFIQTSLPRGTSVAVQTDFDVSKTQQVRKSSPRCIAKQSVMYICHSDSDKDRNTIQTSATQTDSDALSNCNSFEYLYGTEYDLRKNNQTEVIPGPSNVEDGATVMDKFLRSNLKRCPPKSDLTTVTPVSDKTIPKSSSSEIACKESPLAQLLSCQQSQHLIPDLEMKLNLLQKVVKSKKYDHVTKKYYLKKIIQKMINTKYADDTPESYISQGHSESSEVKSCNRESSESDNNYHLDSESSINSSKNSEQLDNEPNLQNNKPWKPIHPTCFNALENSHVIRLSRKRKTIPRKLQTQTFVNEILPGPNNYPKTLKSQELKLTSANFVPIQVLRDNNFRLQRNPLLTLTDHNLPPTDNVIKSGDQKDSTDSSNSTANELYEVLQPALSGNTISTNMFSSENPKQNFSEEVKGDGFQSWREDKTRSEQLLEEKVHDESRDSATLRQENKDNLLSFAKKERDHQLYWINNEISHLNSLKRLLESKQNSDNVDDSEHKALRTLFQNPHIEDMKGIKKSTTVYVVTTEKSARTSRCSASNGNSLNYENPKCSRYINAESERHTNSSGRSSNNVKIYALKPTCPSTLQSSKCCKCRATPISGVKPTFCQCADMPNIPLKPPSLIGYGENVIEIENEKIDLQSARLISNEQFITTNDNKPRKTSIRRYTFEMPVDSLGNSDECVPNCRSPCSKGKQSPPSMKQCPASPAKTDKASPKMFKLTQELVVAEEIGNCSVTSKRSPSVTSKGCSRDTCKSPKPKKVQIEKSSKCCRCSGSSSLSDSSSSESLDSSSTDTTDVCCCCKKLAVCEPKKSCSECNETYILCYPCYYQHQSRACTTCTGSTPYYTYPGHVCTCYNPMQGETVQKIKETIQKLNQLEKENCCKCVCKKKSSTYCARCCNCKDKHKYSKGGMAYLLTLDDTKIKKRKTKKHLPLPEIKIKIESLNSKKRKDLVKHKPSTTSYTTDDGEIAKERCCCPCVSKLENHKKCNCTCHTHDVEDVVRSKPSMSSYTTDDGDKENKCDCCPYVSKSENHKKSKENGEETTSRSKSCKKCNCTCGTPNGENLVKHKPSTNCYTTDEEKENECHCCSCASELENYKKSKCNGKKESASKSRKHKKCNCTCGGDTDDEKKGNEYCCHLCVSKSKNHKKSKNRREKGCATKSKKHKKSHKQPTLQDYLSVNKPSFVVSAEKRRQALLDLAYMREERCDKYKQVLALTKDLPMQHSDAPARKREQVFAPAEVKAITAKNYKKLPEVKQKLLDRKEKQIKTANKLLSNIFNEKLRQQVLRGRHTLPTNTSIINLASY